MDIKERIATSLNGTYYDFKTPKGRTPRRKGNGGTTRYVEYIDKNGNKQIKRVKGMVEG